MVEILSFAESAIASKRGVTVLSVTLSRMRPDPLIWEWARASKTEAQRRKKEFEKPQFSLFVQNMIPMQKIGVSIWLLAKFFVNLFPCHSVFLPSRG
jgi:hypothetical protein